MASSKPEKPRRPPLPGGPYLVLGLARSGTAAALALRRLGEPVLGVDKEAVSSRRQLEEAGVPVFAGGDGSLLDGVATVVKSPGVPPTAPLLLEARRRGLPVVGELELGWRMVERPFLAVTGTNGKTTTVHLIAEIFRVAGQPAVLAGNVGLPVSQLAIDRPPPAATVIAEVSSFQLADGLAFSPEVAVLLNIAPDHLDWHGSFAAYKQAKLRIFAKQRPEDAAVINRSLLGELAAAPPKSTVIPFSGRGSAVFWRAGALYQRLNPPSRRARPLVRAEELRVRGRHNAENVAAAAAAALAAGLPPEAVAEGIRAFKGVPHRLEEVPGPNGVLFINDSKATNVASTKVALEAVGPFAKGGRIFLILGGQGKGQDFRPLRRPLVKWRCAVYLIGEDGPAIARALAGLPIEVEEAGTLERAVRSIADRATAGDLVLLSPGCASFDQFANFEARGERFKELVGAL